MLALCLAALDRYLGAVHVHLPVANLVEPSPCQKSFTRRRVFGNLEVVFLVYRATTKNRLDDAERLATVVRKRDLTGATTMSSSARQLELVFFTGVVVGDRVERIMLIALAWEIGAVGLEGTGVRVVDRTMQISIQWAADGEWLAHLHVSRHTGGQSGTDQKESLHGDCEFAQEDEV